MRSIVYGLPRAGAGGGVRAAGAWAHQAPVRANWVATPRVIQFIRAAIADLDDGG